MKLAEKLIKLGLAVAAVAGIAYLVVTYIDTIKSWLSKVCPYCASEEDVEVPMTEQVEEPVAEEAPAAEETVGEAPAAEEVVIEEGTPVAEETDFEA